MKMETHRIALQRNIPKLFIFQVLRWFLIIMPIVVLYFQENGLSMSQVILTQAAFSVSMLIFEVPSGYFSDKIGRKLTLQIGTLFSFVGMLGLGLFPGFYTFLMSEVILGIGASFISGTDSSLLFDSLTLLDRREEQPKLEGRLMAFANFSESVAGILGGIIAVASMRLSFLIEAGFLLGAFLVATTLYEPPRHGESRHLTFRKFLSEVKDILSLPRRAYFIVFGAVSALGSFLAVWYVQPMLKEAGYPIVLFGIIWAGLNGVVGVASLLSHRLNLQKHAGLFIRVAPFLIMGIYLLVSRATPFLLLAAFLPFYVYRGIQGPFCSYSIHLLTPSDKRATSLSLRSLIMRLIFSAIGPLFGLVADNQGNAAAFLWIGVAYGVFGVMNLAVLRLLPSVHEKAGS